MKLSCSRGHEFDTAHPFFCNLRVGDRCPMEMTYDRIGGSTYCRRVLKESRSHLPLHPEKGGAHERDLCSQFLIRQGQSRQG